MTYQVVRIDTTTGLFIEPIVIEDGVTLTEAVTDANGNITYQPRADIITVSVPEGFHHPKWDGSQWVEGKSDAELLPIKQANKMQEIEFAFATTLANGFPSSADGTSRIYGFADMDAKHWEWMRSMVNAGTCPNPIMVKDIAGNRVNLTPTQAGTLCTDAQNFYLTTYGHLDSKMQEVESATVSTVEAITW